MQVTNKVKKREIEVRCSISLGVPLTKNGFSGYVSVVALVGIIVVIETGRRVAAASFAV